MNQTLKKEDKKNLIDRAIKFAKLKHEGQLDDEGNDYFEAHLRQVADIVTIITNDEEIIVAAYLHDTIEDTKTILEEIVTEFGRRVGELVMELTHEGQKDEYGYYFPRLKSMDAILIKLADRMSNISRMGSWDEKRKAQYLRKTKFWKDGKDLK